MTYREAVKEFKNEVFPQHKTESKTTNRCIFNDWVDSLHKEGRITERQANTWCAPKEWQ